jgi:hypothetical protein
MNGIRLMLSVVAFFVAANVGWSQAPAAQESAGHVSKFYSLADFGHDAQLCKWITDTIPTMIKPESWTTSRAQAGKSGTLSYYAPGKVLVIYQTPAVHAQVDEFLQTLKKTLPREQASAPRLHPVVPAQYVPSNVTPPPMPAPLTQTNGYPVPATMPIPKHLFHFIIRYEGEGIIDSNVVKFAKALGDKAASDSSSFTAPIGEILGSPNFRITAAGNSTPGVPLTPVVPKAEPLPTVPPASGESWRLPSPPLYPGAPSTWPTTPPPPAVSTTGPAPAAPPVGSPPPPSSGPKSPTQ